MKFIFLCILNLYLLKHISEEGLNLIKEGEGFISSFYSDIASVGTIGYGTTSSVQKIIGTKIYNGLTITKEVAEDWLIKTLKYRYERVVNKYDKYYTFTQGQFDALVSFAYNSGEGNLNSLLQNGERSKEVISSKLLEYNKFKNQTSKKYEVSKGLTNRRNKEKQLFDKVSENSGITNKIIGLSTYRKDLGTIQVYLLKEDQTQQNSDEEDMNILYYDLNGHNYRTKCKYEYSSPNYVIRCKNTESIQYEGNIYFKLNKETKLLNGDIILPFDSKDFTGDKYATFDVIDSFTKLQITYFYELYYTYYSVYSYGNYFSYIFRLSTKLKNDVFPK